MGEWRVRKLNFYCNLRPALMSNRYNIETIEHILSRVLWGYSALLLQFQERVKPELVPVLEENMQNGVDRQENGASEGINDLLPSPHEIELQNEDDIGGTSSNPDTTGSPDVRSGSQFTAQPVVQSKDEMQAEYPSSPSDEHQRFAEQSHVTEPSAPTTSLQPAAPEIAEASSTRTEIEEVPITVMGDFDGESAELEEKLEW